MAQALSQFDRVPCHLQAVRAERPLGAGSTRYFEARRPGTRPARPGPVRQPDEVSILGVSFQPLPPEQAVAAIRAMIASRGTHQVVLANAHTLNMAHQDPAYRQILQQASLRLRDGVGVELAAKLMGRRLPHNFVGTDFVPYLLSQLGSEGVRIFLYGAQPGVAAAAAEVLARGCPGTQIVGVEHGYVDTETVVRRVRGTAPDLLLVALGNPLQEEFIAAHLPRLNVRVAIGVGALFDFLAGRVRRAPEWVRRMRAEWIFRLCVEPGRLWRRYIMGNPKFIWRVVKARMQLEPQG